MKLVISELRKALKVKLSFGDVVVPENFLSLTQVSPAPSPPPFLSPFSLSLSSSPPSCLYLPVPRSLPSSLPPFLLSLPSFLGVSAGGGGISGLCGWSVTHETFRSRSGKEWRGYCIE